MMLKTENFQYHLLTPRNLTNRKFPWKKFMEEEHSNHLSRNIIDFNNGVLLKNQEKYEILINIIE